MFVRPKAAFTILELLIAAAITSVIVVMLGTMFGSLSSTASHASERIEAFRDARAAIHMIERDLSHLVLPRSGSPAAAYFAINYDTSNASGSYARHVYALISAKNNPAAAPPPAAGDMCAVGYYCGWDPSSKSYRLYRYFRDSVSTFNVFSSNCSADGTLTYVDTNKLYQLTASDDVLAGNCWNLIVTAYDANGAILSPQSYFGGTTTTAPYVCDPSGTNTNVLPATIEISFKAMSQNAARTVIATGAGPSVWMAEDENGASQADKDTYRRLIAPHTYQFRTRIKLR
jgi:type II secretory pathway pseudopilin PulG